MSIAMSFIVCEEHAAHAFNNQWTIFRRLYISLKGIRPHDHVPALYTSASSFCVSIPVAIHATSDNSEYSFSVCNTYYSIEYYLDISI